VNRQTKRLLQRQGQIEADGTPALRQPVQPRPRPVGQPRTTPAEFLQGVRTELRRVAWPGRSEVVNYSTVVLVTLAVLISLIFLLNYGFSKAVLFLFKA
jgi:preprotein translocase subunit SecE